jgi:hypothetical protein
MTRSNDIEDVLSSIRRLVADDAPHAMARPERAGPEGALVLDQTRRVADPEHPFQTVSPLPAIRVPAEAAPPAGQAPDAKTPTETPSKITSLPRRETAAPKTDLGAPSAEGDDDATDLSELGRAADGDEALRRLIEEVVRQELSGALGERITRNVRKLVRREIQRVLSEETFD